MISFGVYSLLGTLDGLAIEEAALAKLPDRSSTKDIPPDRLQSLLGVLTRADDGAKAIECDACFNALGHAHDAIRLGQSIGAVREHLRGLRRAIVDELEFRTFCYVPQEGRKMLLSQDTDWQSVWRAFPSTEENARRGVECFALGLDVACVFHMMLILEKGLAALADRLEVKRGVKEWGRLIGEIETEISTRTHARANMPKGSKPLSARAVKTLATQLAFYSEAAKEFTYFREAWRNHVAHGRTDYDRNDARKVMVHVREFMAILSRHLRERKQ